MPPQVVTEAQQDLVVPPSSDRYNTEQYNAMVGEM